MRFLKKWLKENSVDAIISTGPPHSMHLIAKKLHHKLQIPWVADFRDPWTRLFYFKHLSLTNKSSLIHRLLELSILRDASKITVVTSQMRDDYIGDLKGDMIKMSAAQAEEKVTLIENGYDPYDFDESINTALKEEVIRIAEKTEDKFVIAHTGLLTNSANPPEFWKAIGILVAENENFANHLQIVVAGQTDEMAKDCFAVNGIEKYLLDLGYSPHPAAVALQKRANILLLPLRKEPEAAGILTGKLFEYLASGSHIIAFGYKGCELERILNETSAGVLFEYAQSEGDKTERGRIAEENRVNEIKQEIERIWTEYKTKKSFKNSSAGISKYSRIAQAEAFAKLLDSVI